VLTKEIEKAGIPTVLITTLVPTAKTVGANRIVQGAGITHPLGNPKVSEAEEMALRKRLLGEAFRLLTEP
jgi:glycine/betaine/sarcosine/D-proline reductase family selenoprotein B